MKRLTKRFSIFIMFILPLTSCKKSFASGDHPPIKIPDFGRVIGSKELPYVTTVDVEYDSINGQLLSKHLDNNVSSGWKPVDKILHGKWKCTGDGLQKAMNGCLATYTFVSEDMQWKLYIKAIASDSSGNGLKWSQFSVTSMKTAE